VGEHIPPPRVLPGYGDADVVRHDVDEQAEARLVRARREPLEARATAPRLVDAGRVDDVVPSVACRIGER
jgi:hypothetical protein